MNMRAQQVVAPEDASAPEPRHDGALCAVLARIRDKWSVLVLLALRRGPQRFGMLQRLIPGEVSHRMLTLTLRGLERDGLVSRTVTASVPPRVDYALTPLGRSLQEQVDALGLWGQANGSAVEAARMAFDQRT